MRRHERIRAAFALACAALLPSVASAQHPLPQGQVWRGLVGGTRPVLIGRARHNVFGAIVSIKGNRFSLRTRSGRMVLVDDTAAIARGTFSAPLFSGKIVMVGGAFDTLRVLHALTVTRQPRIDATTPADS